MVGGAGRGGGSESWEAEVELGGVSSLFWWFGFLVHVWFLRKMVFENHVGRCGENGNI